MITVSPRRNRSFDGYGLRRNNLWSVL